MIVLQVLGWALFLYAFWRVIRVGWDAFVESFTGTPPTLLPRDAGPRTDARFLPPSGEFPGREAP